ncbi:MAG: hypothetical protein U9N12_05160 [Euryarchaeota archaeon]|nr:hypothetical protein [Euryarchaeota archaeon]
MAIVLNSTPLIYLAKVGLISIIEETEDDLIIPGRVFDEVVTVGRQRGDTDSFIIEECVKRGLLQDLHRGVARLLELERFCPESA